MEGTVKIHLLGKLGQVIGREWEIFAENPAEAIRAIDINTKGKLREYLSGDGGKKFYRVSLQKNSAKSSLEAQELYNKSGSSDIYIVPVVNGSNSGWGKILAGVVLLVVSYGFGAGFFGAATSTMAKFGAAFTMSMGAALVLGGISQLLTPTSKEGEEMKSSSVFQGNATTVYQGGCVPIVYGRTLVTPMPIGIAFSSDKIGTTSVGGTANVEITKWDGNGGLGGYIQYQISRGD